MDRAPRPPRLRAGGSALGAEARNVLHSMQYVNAQTRPLRDLRSASPRASGSAAARSRAPWRRESPLRRLDLDDSRWAASNEAVVRGFWGAAAPGYQPPLPAAMVAAAIAHADGNVLHAVMLHDAWRDLPVS